MSSTPRALLLSFLTTSVSSAQEIGRFSSDSSRCPVQGPPAHPYYMFRSTKSTWHLPPPTDPTHQIQHQVVISLVPEPESCVKENPTISSQCISTPKPAQAPFPQERLHPMYLQFWSVHWDSCLRLPPDLHCTWSPQFLIQVVGPMLFLWTMSSQGPMGRSLATKRLPSSSHPTPDCGLPIRGGVTWSFMSFSMGVYVNHT